MYLLKRPFIAVLIVLTFNLYLPSIAMTQEQYAKADVPAHPPKSWSTPEIKIKEEKPKKKGNWISRNKWYVMLGLVVLAGGAAAIGGSGGGDNGNGGEDNGEVDYSW